MSSHPFLVIAALLACTALAPVVLIGTVGVISDDGPLRPVFGVMAVTGVLGIGGGLRTAWRAIRAGRAEAVRVAGARGDGPATGSVVARWAIDGGESRAFARQEWSARRREVPTTAAIVFVIGSGLLWLAEDGPAWAAFAAGGLLATLYLAIGLGKYGLEYQAAMRAGTTDVIVFPDAVVVCGTWHALGGDRELLGVRLSADMLEFKVRWQTRGGPAEDTIRVPVPRERREDADRVLTFFSVTAPGRHPR